MNDLTQLLNAAAAGDAQAANELFGRVYHELRRLAAQKMAREAPGHTLQATALVNEAWLRIGGDQQPLWENRAHFFKSAAEAMPHSSGPRPAQERSTARRQLAPAQ